MEGLIAELLKIISIILLTMLKFIFGPVLGFKAGFSYPTTVIITIVGMMLSVILFTFFGELARKYLVDPFFKSKRLFTKRTRRFVKIWKHYGVNGVALLTPLLLTPIGGTILLTSYNTPRRKIVMTMFLSATFWSIVITGLVYFFGEAFIRIVDQVEPQYPELTLF